MKKAIPARISAVLEQGPPGPPEAESPEVEAPAAASSSSSSSSNPSPAEHLARSDTPVIIRELHPAEMPQLIELGLFADMGMVPDMSHARVIVAQEAPLDEAGNPRAGKLCAYWVVFDAVHVEPLWIAPEHRNRPQVARGLWDGVREILSQTGAPMAFACIGDADLPGNEVLVRKLGFSRVPGQLFFVEVKEDGRPSPIGEAIRQMSLTAAAKEKPRGEPS